MDNKLRLGLEGLSKSFTRRSGQTVKAIDNVTLDIDMGEFIVLLGPSGCGKTTLLRCVAGLENPDSGRIEFIGQSLFDSSSNIAMPPENRRIGMMFQSYALWPHMTVEQNIAYPLQMHRLDAATSRRRVDEVMEMMNVAELAQQFPGTLSGGQQQRVALARALVRGDNLILFDEPLSNVDAKVREHLRFELLAKQRELGFTALYVTHDQDEAMALATRIAVLSRGTLAQVGSPQDVYRRPTSAYVAGFVGVANMFEGVLTGDGAMRQFDTPLGTLAVSKTNVFARKTHVLGISRPEAWIITTQQPQASQSWRGRVKLSAFLGPYNEYLVDLGVMEIKIRATGDRLIPVGEEIWCTLKESLVIVDRD